MRVEKQPAYILHQRAFRDTSQILEVFTKDYGRLSIMSRGSRAQKSRLRSILQPFRALELGWSGRGEMPTLISAEPAAQSVAFLQGKSLACALYVNELVMYLIHKHDVHESLFSQYHQTVNRLFETQKLEFELRHFELSLLDHLGVLVDLSLDAVTGKRLKESSKYYFHIERGLCEFDYSFEPEKIPVLTGSSLLAISENRLDQPEVLKDAKKLMRYLINYSLAGKPLKSRELFR
ncbi:MAG: DNA repair protein RecO [Gammaproteobacteria bacterium]|nr:DNA repair protein RecO [Gammaproteobacteria bacterium]